MASDSIPTSMKAWVGGPGAGKPTRTTVPVPALEADDILVKVTASGVCHSDCFILGLPEPIPGWKEKFVMGHEGAGVIVKTGSGVDPSLRVGLNVAILCTPGCGQPSCTECSRGHHNICRAGKNPGLGSDGVFSDYAVVKPWGVVPVPDGIPPEVAAVSGDAVLTAWHAVKVLGKVEAGQTVLIFGLGGVGFNALQIALYLGASRVIVVEQRKELLEEAVKLGVAQEDAILIGGDVKAEEKVATEGIAVDAVIDFVGTEETFTSAQLSVRQAGTLVLVGLFGPKVPFLTLPALMKGMNIQCCYNGVRPGLVECMELIKKGIIKPRVETGSIDDLPQVLDDLNAGKIKARMVLMPAA